MRLHYVPWPFVILLGIVLMLGIALIGPIVRARLFHIRDDEHRANNAFEGYKLMGSLTAVVVGFSLIQEVQNVRAAEQTVAQEARDMSQLDRVMLRFGEPSVAALREPLHAYAQLVLEKEWSAMRPGVPAPDVAPALGRVVRGILGIDPSGGRKTELYHELVTLGDCITDSRAARLSMARQHLPAPFWAGITVLVLTVAFLMSLVSNNMNSRLAVGGFAVGLGMVLALLFILDSPFHGVYGVSSEPIQNALGFMCART